MSDDMELELPEWDEDDDNECEGHESLAGAFHGVSYFCDGSCK